MDLVDTHCHLQFDKLSADIAAVLSSAADAGVRRMICVGTSVEDSAKAIDFARGYDNIWAAVGVHPHASKTFDYKNQTSELERLVTSPRVVALGEIGLDFYKNYSLPAEQEKLFRRQLEIGLAAGLPIIFHVRDAWNDFWRILSNYGEMHGVVHSFSSGRKQADKILEKGLFIGLNGIMTFTRDQAQLEAAKSIPLDRLVLETDAPFLTPAPYRNDICEPKHVAVTAEFLADLRSESVKELAKSTSDNAARLFALK